MENTVKMAGEVASHAIWSVSSGETLIPIVGYLKTDHSRSMERLVMDSVQAVSLGEQKISSLDSDKLGAAFVKDGYVTLDTGKTDALIVDVRFADNVEQKIQFIIPYRNANHPQGFAVHRLKLTQLEGISSDEVDALSNAFFDGIEAHAEGGKLWEEKYVDQAGDTAELTGEDASEFSPEDFEALKRSPFLVFFIVAAADGKVDKKELLSFIEILSDPEKYSNGLLNRIVTNVINDVSIIVTTLADSSLDYIEELGNLRRIIDDNLPPEEAIAFKMCLLLIAKEIAEASGGFLGFGSKISKDEKVAIAAIAMCLGIEPAQ
jgi:tellurite resistance protein